MTAPARDLHAWLAERAGRMAALLEQLVHVETPSTTPSTFPPLQDEVEAALAELGFSSRRVAGVATGGWTVSHRPGEQEDVPPQLLVGHLDTVWPVGTLAARGELRADGVVHGPGAYDMKAGIVQLVFALRAIDALDLSLPVPPVVLCTTDEEIGSRESTPALVALARCADRALVLEPSLGPTGRVKTARKGVGRFTVTVTGRAAHAGLDPDGGASAILELTHVVQALFAMNEPAAGVTVNVGRIDGGLRPNVVAPRSAAVVDVRVATQDDLTRVEAAIRGLEASTAGTEVTVEGGFGRPPMERTEGTAALWELAAAAADDLGVDLAEGTAGGASDGNTTAPFTPTLDGLGAVGDGAHAEHEHVVPPVSRPVPTLPQGGVPALLDALPTPAESGPVTPVEAIRTERVRADRRGRGR